MGFEKVTNDRLTKFQNLSRLLGCQFARRRKKTTPTQHTALILSPATNGRKQRNGSGEQQPNTATSSKAPHFPQCPTNRTSSKLYIPFQRSRSSKKRNKAKKKIRKV